MTCYTKWRRNINMLKTVSADFKKNISDNSATSNDYDDSDADKDYVPDDIENIASNQQVNIYFYFVACYYVAINITIQAK